MFAPGIKEKIIANELSSGKCTNCGASDCVRIELIQKYLLLFFHLPFAPISRRVRTRCEKCGITIEINGPVKNHYNSYLFLQTKNKTPLWTFTGTLLLIGIMPIFIALMLYASPRDPVNLMAHPQRRDVYVFQYANTVTNVLLLDHFTKDTLYFVAPEHQPESQQELYDLEFDKHLVVLTKSIPISRKEILARYYMGQIKQIDR